MKICLLLLLLAAGLARVDAATGNYAVVHFPTSTKSAVAQRCVDRGLTLYYSYNRFASQKAFECAAKADPTFAMAYWGIALAKSPNINVPIDPAAQSAAYAAIQKAVSLKALASPRERAYIDALAVHYTKDAKPDLPALASRYTAAMKNLVAKYPNDLEAANMYAESAMELQSWAWYGTNGAPIAQSLAIRKTIDSVLKRDPHNIAANHLQIHMTEESLRPQDGLAAANYLHSLHFEPAASHLTHMPAHTYNRTGDWDLAIAANEEANRLDVIYLRQVEGKDVEAQHYHDHNLTMLATSYVSQGNWDGAKRTNAWLAKDGYVIPTLFAGVRFERWNDILSMAAPKNNPDEPFAIQTWHFARGMAFAGTGRLPEAQKELAYVRNVRDTMNAPGVTGFNNSSASLFSVASDELAAKIAGAKGQHAAQIALLRSAVARQDSFIYIEPPDWYGPAREALGTALFNSGDYADAAAVFNEDLKLNPRNPRSLYGLWASLAKQGNASQASSVRNQFTEIWKGGANALDLRH